MRVLTLALTLALVAAQPALSLSCMAPDPVRAYQEADAAPESWGAVVGRLDFNENRLPEVDWDRQDEVPPVTRLRAQLVGHSLGPDGWQKPFQANVALIVECFGPWCARPVSGLRYLVFIKQERNRFVAYADPCNMRLFPQPSREDLDRVQSCFLGGPCEPEIPFR